MRKPLLPLLALAVLGGCSLLWPDQALVRFSFRSPPDSPVTREMLRLEWNDGGNDVHALDGEDFEPTNDFGTPHTREFRTRRSGRMEMRFLLSDGAVQVAAGSVEISLRSDWRWGVDLVVATEDPADTCFGCAGSKSFPIAPAFQRTPADSLWVVWGGNFIKDPVIY